MASSDTVDCSLLPMSPPSTISSFELSEASVTVRLQRYMLITCIAFNLVMVGLSLPVVDLMYASTAAP